MSNPTVSFFNLFSGMGMTDPVKGSRVSRDHSTKDSAKRARKDKRVARRINRK